MANGGRLGHRFTRLPPPWIPGELHQNGTFRTQQEGADAEAAIWHGLWAADTTQEIADGSDDHDSQDLDDEHDKVDWQALLQDEQDLPMPEIDELIDCAKTFGQFLAIGKDYVHPKHIATMSDEGLRCCVELMSTMVRLIRDS